MAADQAVRVSRIDKAITLVKFGRPPHNFLESGLIAAIADAYEEIAASPAAGVIVLASDGKNFCAGADFSRVQDEGDASETPAALPARAVQATYAEAARLMAAPLPVVAAVQGAAVGGGFGLACTADFRVGSPRRGLRRTSHSSASIMAWGSR